MTRATLEQIFVQPTEMEMDDIHRLRKHTNSKRSQKRSRKNNRRRQDHRALMAMTRKIKQEW